MQHFCEMTLNIDKIFLPSKGVDIVFNINSMMPYSRGSIIYDINLKSKEIIIAQPLIPFTKNTEFRELHLTNIIHNKNRKFRVGVKCVQFKLIKKYQLANKTYVPAVSLKYKLPVTENNIRSAFRLPLSTIYAIKAKIFYNQLEYTSPRDFTIRDISLSGLGLIIPKQKLGKTNPLSLIKPKEKILIGIILINTKQQKPIGTFPLTTTVARMKTDYSDTQYLMGVKILNIKTNHENMLNKFIHEAQVAELKRISMRNL